MRIAIIFMLLLTLLGADDDDHRRYNRHLPLDISYLSLTPSQHESVERIVRKHQEEHHRFNRKKEKVREAIGLLFAAESFDKTKFLELTASLRDEAGRIQAEFFASIHAVLTPKQRRHFALYMEEWEIE